MSTRLGTGTGVGSSEGLFAPTMSLVALTMGLFALGAYLGRNLTEGWGWAFYIGAFACLIAMRFAVRAASGAATGLLLAFGMLMGLATAPTLAYYAATDPRAVWDAALATALFMAALGAAGYATRADLSGVARLSFWALLGLIVFGIVMVFVDMPGADVAYSVLGLVVFAGLTLVDFQRLRTSSDVGSAPLMAAWIFLDGLKVFLFFLNIFDRRD
ncbi:MAG TPA: Bax inhibitor-1 family protein [Acidimicrobiales bacterium]|nr:Bax inhibitor-1 family protein [Acidimicrobiales bacterium]